MEDRKRLIAQDRSPEKIDPKNEAETGSVPQK
jgi:hypothetical protein